MRQNAIQVKGLRHFYDSPTRRFLLDVPELSIPMGSLTTFQGPSGCGKTTLHSRLGLLLNVTSDEQSSVEEFRIVESSTGANPNRCHDIAELMKQETNGRSKIEALRRRLMGFYLQNGELIPTLTIKENVAMPLRLNGVPTKETDDRVNDLLGFLLDVPKKNIPNKLALDSSGGEYQRVALARAIAHKPQILFVDEPTSSLDTPNKHRVLDLMIKLVREEDATVVMITHDEILARTYSDFIVNFQANHKGWDNRISLEFRESDGFGQPVSYEAKIGENWLPTNSSFQPEYTANNEEQHVA